MKKSFTLIEVVVSIAILALSLAGLLQLLTQSQLRIANADEKWREMHMLTQGVEYLMMISNTEDLHVPDEVFPYENYQIECELNGQDGQVPLKKWSFSLIRLSDRKERLTIHIDRPGYEEMENAQ